MPSEIAHLAQPEGIERSEPADDHGDGRVAKAARTPAAIPRHSSGRVVVAEADDHRDPDGRDAMAASERGSARR